MKTINTLFNKQSIEKAKDKTLWTMFYMIICLLTFLIGTFTTEAIKYFF